MTATTGQRTRPKPLRCRMLGHHWGFWHEGPVVHWACRQRGCPAGGRHDYGDKSSARRMVVNLRRSPPVPGAGLLAALAGTVHDSRRAQKR